MHVLVRGPAMTAFGPIPQHGPRARYVGSVQDLAGKPLHVSINGDAVCIGTFTLNLAQCETFAQLLVRAVWLAGQDKEAV